MIICVFDTETVGKVSQDLLNVGYRIVDLNVRTNEYKDLVARDYIVSTLFNNVVYMLNDDFVGAKKFAMLKQAIENKTAKKHSIEKIMDLMCKDFEKYKPAFAYAYNSNFDVDKFNKTCSSRNLKNPLGNVEVIDIMPLAIKYICYCEEYIEFCKNNGILTESKMYIQTSVEGVTKYLEHNLDFVEDHTALSDTWWELKILLECNKRGADITKNIAKLKNPPSDYEFIYELNGEQYKFKKSYTRNGVTYFK